MRAVSFQQFLQEINFTSQLEYGKFIRYGERKSKWLLVLNNNYAVAGDWKKDCSGNPTHSFKQGGVTEEEAKKIALIIEQQKEKQEASHNKAKEKAKDLLNSCEESINNPYLLRKGIKFTAKVKGETLIVPIYSDGTELTSLQYIKPDGTKRFLYGGKVKNGCTFINKEFAKKKVVICEGYATGITIAQNYEQEACVIVAFSAANLKNIATWIHGKIKHNNIIIAADNDKPVSDTASYLFGKQVGIHYATEAAKVINAQIAVPPELGDWNDIIKKDALAIEWNPSPIEINDLEQDTWDSLNPPEGLVKDIVDWICESTDNPDKSFIGLAVLAYVGAVLGQKVESETNLRTNLYTMLFAKTGHGKNHARQQLSLLDKYVFPKDSSDTESVGYVGKSKWESGNGIVDALIQQEANIGKASLVSLMDEFGELYKGIKEGNIHKRDIISVFLNMYSEAYGTYKGAGRVTNKDAGKEIQNPNLCIYATTTLSTMAEHCKKSDIESGLFPRFIVMNVEDKKRRIKMPTAKATDAPNHVITSKLKELAGTEHIKLYSYETDSLRTKIYKIQQEFSNYENDIKRAIYSRVIENSIKVALIQSASNNSKENVITEETFNWALSLCKASADYLYKISNEEFGDSDFHLRYLKIIKHIKMQEYPITKVELLTHFLCYEDKIINDALKRGLTINSIEKIVSNNVEYYK